jgi:ubiquinone biosynthesis protein
MSEALTVALWVLFAVPAAVAVTIIGGRLLGTRRSWVERLVSGGLGWTSGLVIAGVLTGWEWTAFRMVFLTLLFGTLLTMVIAVGLDMLATPGSLLHGEVAGRVALVSPAKAFKAAVAPLGRYRELLRIARANGLLGRPPRSSDPEAIAALGAPLRRTLEDAGGMFVKLGQVASSRTDLLPASLCDELALLRSAAAPAPVEEGQPFLEAELGMPVTQAFAEFDWTPMASASIAQVYAARLHSGRPVVVKMERPGIEEVMARDSAVLEQMATALERHTTLGLALKPTELADEFILGVREELDFNLEAANAGALAAATPPGCGVRLPEVITELSTSRVLVEERIHGVSITDRDAIAAHGLDPQRLARTLVEVTLGQVFDAGVFHADPHPGNILVEPDGTIVLIDLGAVGRLGHRQRQVFVELLAGAMSGDSTVVREALDDAGMVETGAKGVDLDAAIDQFLARHVGNGAAVDSSVFEELFAMLATYGIRPPRWLTSLGRSFVVLEGTLRTVDPTFSLIDSAIEVASQRARQMPRPDTVRETIEVEAAKQIPRLRRIPQRVDELLGQATRGRLTARISLFADDDDLRTITRLVDRAVLAMVTSALGIGSVLLLHTSGPAVGASVDVNEVLGYIGIAVSSILALRIIAGVIRDGVL